MLSAVRGSAVAGEDLDRHGLGGRVPGRGGRELGPVPVQVHGLQPRPDRPQVPDVDRAGVGGDHHQPGAVGGEAQPGGPVAVRVLEPGHGPAGGRLHQMDDGRRHLQGHEPAVRRERHVTGVVGDLPAEPADRLQGLHVPEAELVAPGDDQGPAVGGEEDEGSLSEDPFADHPTRADIPEPDAVRVPAAARRPPAVPAEGPDLPLRMDAQLPPHRSRFQVQDLVGPPSTVTAPSARPSGPRVNQARRRGDSCRGGPRRRRRPAGRRS